MGESYGVKTGFVKDVIQLDYGGIRDSSGWADGKRKQKFSEKTMSDSLGDFGA